MEGAPVEIRALKPKTSGRRAAVDVGDQTDGAGDQDPARRW
jgi:hypothetical protein